MFPGAREVNLLTMRKHITHYNKYQDFCQTEFLVECYKYTEKTQKL